MQLRHDKTLITGMPGIGKTTLIKAIVTRLPSVRMAGFVTTEVRSKGSRVGFELQGLEGRRQMLAHVEIASRHRVGRYGVDTIGFETFLDRLTLQHPEVEMLVIDEIGKMELFSKQFRRLITELLDSDVQLLASIALKGEGLIRQIKQRPDIHLYEVTLANRDHLMDAILV